jgi:hypothetical protein
VFDVAFNIVFYVGLVIFTLGGFGLIWVAAAHLRLAVRSRRWPRAKLEILNISTRSKRESRLVRKNLHAGDPSAATWSSKTVTAHYPALLYAYEVDGRRYESSNVDPWNREGSSGSNANDVVDKQRAWAKDREVPYDPQDPSVHVLGWAHFPVFQTVLGFTLGPFLASGIVVLVRDSLGLFDIAVPRVGDGEHSIVFLVVLIFLVVALLLARHGRDEAAS